jgi:hypothetical protein
VQRRELLLPDAQVIRVDSPKLFCPYCGRDKPPEEFTDEHALSRGVGGGLKPTNPFKLRVCKECNDFCGDYVDGPALRGFLGMLSRADAIKPIGRLEGWTEDDAICDFWVGPAGNQVFHFHRAYPSGDVMIRGASWAKRKKRKLDPGVVLIGVVPTNPAWFPLIVRSVHETFPDAEAYALNAPPGVPAKYQRHVDWIGSLPETRTCQVIIDPHAGERFAAKLALGIGSIFLGDAFQRSDSAAALRAFVRGDKVRLRGLPPFNPARDGEQMIETFGWRQCHTIFMLPTGPALSLVAVLYGSHPLALAITDDLRMWQGKLRDGGLAWAVAPRLHRFVGPTSVPEMLIDMQLPTPIGPLAALDALLKAEAPLPPVHLETD